MTARTPSIDVDDIDLANLDNYVDGPPRDLYALLRREAPVHRNPLSLLVSIAFLLSAGFRVGMVGTAGGP